jgi:hypothetical protein
MINLEDDLKTIVCSRKDIGSCILTAYRLACISLKTHIPDHFYQGVLRVQGRYFERGFGNEHYVWRERSARPAMSQQASSEPSNTARKFTGTWRWMFEVRSFATIVVVRHGSGFTGTVTGSRITLNDDGGLSQADPSEDSAPKPIAKASLEGSALHITVSDGFEFIVTLKDETHAEILPAGAPP